MTFLGFSRGRGRALLSMTNQYFELTDQFSTVAVWTMYIHKLPLSFHALLCYPSAGKLVELPKDSMVSFDGSPCRTSGIARLMRALSQEMLAHLSPCWHLSKQVEVFRCGTLFPRRFIRCLSLRTFLSKSTFRFLHPPYMAEHDFSLLSHCCCRLVADWCIQDALLNNNKPAWVEFCTCVVWWSMQRK